MDEASSSNTSKPLPEIPPAFPKTFGWIGLGAMGHPMALQLRTKVPPGTLLHVYDVDANALESFVGEAKEARKGIKEGDDEGAEVVKCGCSREVAEKSECIITIVPEGAHVKAVFLTSETGILAAPDISGKLFIDCSTIDIQTSLLVGQAVAETYAAQHGKDSASAPSPPHFIDAPVSGGTAGAAVGSLSIMVGCASTSPLLPLLTLILRTMGTHIHALGAPSLGLAAKLSNNYLSGLIALATSEAMNLGMRLGIEPSVLKECFSKGSGGSWVNDTVNPVPGVCPKAVTSRGYEGGFKVQLMKKDMGLAIAAAQQVGAKLVLADAGLGAYTAASDDPRCRDRDSRVVYRWLGGVEPDVNTHSENEKT